MENSPLPFPASAAPCDGVLHPAVWRAHQLGHLPQPTWPSGWPALDAQLPGGGWPAQALTELLLPHPGIGELRLLSPVLAAVQRQQRVLMLFGAPARLCPWSWQALGLALQPLLMVNGGARPAAAQRLADLLWALEQALASGHAGAVLAWLPARLPPDALRRLQLAAQNHPGPAFLLRELALQAQPSPAPLRLRLQPASADELTLQVFKRRGAPMAAPISVALPPVLAPAAKARAARGLRTPSPARHAEVAEGVGPSPSPAPNTRPSPAAPTAP